MRCTDIANEGVCVCLQTDYISNQRFPQKIIEMVVQDFILFADFTDIGIPD
jgi:hypothetical protein